MEQHSSTVHSIDEQVNVIDEIFIPENTVAAYAEKSVLIRNILRQQSGFVKYQIFQQQDASGNLSVITIATWASPQHIDNAKSVIQTEMKKTGINMSEFLKQQGITIERGIYYSVGE